MNPVATKKRTSSGMYWESMDTEKHLPECAITSAQADDSKPSCGWDWLRRMGFVSFAIVGLPRRDIPRIIKTGSFTGTYVRKNILDSTFIKKYLDNPCFYKQKFTGACFLIVHNHDRPETWNVLDKWCQENGLWVVKLADENSWHGSGTSAYMIFAQ